MKEIVASLVDQIKPRPSGEETVTIGRQKIIIDTARVQSIQENQSSGRLAFIDGGNAELLRGQEFTLQFIRVYAVVFEGIKKVREVKHEFFLLGKIVAQNDQLFFSAQLFAQTGELLITSADLEIPLNDPSLRQGLRVGSVSSLGDLARRFSELALAKRLQESVEHVFLDGNLEQTYTHEDNYLEKLNEKVSALAKTSTLLTDQGHSVSALLSPAPGAWVYTLGEVRGVSVSFSKLHPRSEYVFMLQSRADPVVVASALISLSRDPIFLGYPYGLLYADQMARVSNQEKEYLLTKLKVLLGKEFASLRPYLNTANAHDVLDRIR